MITFQEFIEVGESQTLEEALITFGGKAYPKFGNVLIMAGGAGSGKGFVQKHLIGLEGFTYDVDHLKGLVIKSKGIRDRIQKEFSTDPAKLQLKNPRDVMRLHELVAGIKKDSKTTTKATEKFFKKGPVALDDRKIYKLYDAIFTSDPRRRPNVIFDVTLKKFSKLDEICTEMVKLGYDKKNIHIVWVVQDLNIARAQNSTRDRTVPDGREDELGQLPDILFQTHKGASQTMSEIISNAERLKVYMDGDIVFAFAKKDVDNSLAKSDFGGSFLKKANYFYVKRAGKPSLKKEELSREIISKIKGYQPANTWA